MILSTLDLNPHCFIFGLFPQKVLYQLDIIHAYILIGPLIPNRYETLWDFRHTPNNTKPPLKPGFTLSITKFKYTPYMKHHLPSTHHSPHHFVQLPTTRLSLNLTMIPLAKKSSWTYFYRHWYDIVHLSLNPHVVFGKRDKGGLD